MSQTISGTYSDNVTLSGNPATVTSTALISGSSAGAIGLIGPGGTAWALLNQGSISETGVTSMGISFAAGGTITNDIGGVIGGILHGVYLGDSATVTNAGRITADLAGNTDSGVLLAAGGLVSNQSGGTVSGYFGIDVPNGAGTVINAGVIAGSGSAGNAVGVDLRAGGSVTNQSGGRITGYQAGVRIATTPGTVLNLGYIHSTPTAFGNTGVSMTDGGVVTNGASGGTVSAAYIGGYTFGVNFGTTGVGLLTNFGTVSGLPGSTPIEMASGTVVNGPSGATGALIVGDTDIIITGSGTVINFGTIIGGGYTGAPHYYGIKLGGAGSISNFGSHSLIQAYYGIDALSNDTVTNAGIIASNTVTGTALRFNSGTNLLIVDPGATFVGRVLAAGTSTLELASGASAGNLAGLGSSITNFASLVFDAGSQWTVAGNTSASGFGALPISGFSFGDTIDLTGFQAISRTAASNSLVLTDTSNAHATLAIQGAFATGNMRITNDGSTGTDISLQRFYAETIDEAGTIATSQTVSGGVMTLFNSGTSVGTVIVGTSLGTGDFSLRSDGLGGTDVIVHTASGSYSSGITLSVNPTTIGSLATISDTASSGIGVRGTAGTSWSVANLGTISESGTGSIGISLAAAGTISNATGGRIGGAQDGVLLAGGGLITAQSGGKISGTVGVTIGGGTGTVLNAGSIAGNLTAGSGIALSAGGSVTNVSGGTISGSYGVVAASVAVTVVNAGSIGDGTTLPTGAAIALKHGGMITNQVGGQIVAGLQAIYFGGAIGTLINAGSIGGGPTTGNGIIVTAGVVVTNQAGGVITGKYGLHAIASAATVVNYGSIGGNQTASGAAGIALAAGGAVTNHSGGTITGLRGVAATGGSVTNAGAIAGNAASGTGVGVQLISGAAFSNQSGGTVTGFAAVYAKTGAATVANSGNIGGNTTSGSGVRLAAGGAVTNLSGGVVSGFDGILSAGSATVVNAGSISGTTAVSFGAGATNLLVAEPGAVFTGLVDGGNTIGASFASTLELASGASAGTLGGLGNQFVHFAQTTIDANADWTVSGSNTVVAGATLTNSGTLTDSGTLVNNGTLAGNRLNLSGGVLINQAGAGLTASYVYGALIGGADTVVNLGSISSSANAAIYLRASGAVTNTAGATITGLRVGVKLDSTAASVTNLGQINATQGIGSYGVELHDGGMLTNGQAGPGTSTASVEGYYGVAVRNAAGTINNYGTILGDGSRAVDFGGTGGTLVNGASGATAALIRASSYGVHAIAGSVTNDATIIATGTASQNYGVAILTSGMVSNLGTTSLIEGNGGVQFDTDGTLLNAGTIESNQGSAGVAVDFVSGNARLIDKPGAVFIGSIFGGTGGTAVLELASAGSAGTIAGLGTSVTNFTSLVFDNGAQWTVAGNDSASGLGTLGISGFTLGDTIDLTGFAAVSRTFASNALVLNDGSTGHATLAMQGSFATANFQISSDDNGGTDIVFANILPCFAAGTRIGTPDGAVPVEHLHQGDILLTISGRSRPIQWIGRRTVDCVRHTSPRRVKPIRIAPNAFGKDRPSCALMLSPDHCVFVDNVLIPVKYLVNGTTITQLEVPTVTYFHIELPNHDVVLAEGLPVETYLEMGGRSAFENGGGALQLHPNFEADAAHVAMVWESSGYAPAVISGRQLSRVQAQLASQARMLGYLGDAAAQPVKRASRVATLRRT